MGLLPGIGAWGALMAKNGVRAAGASLTPNLLASFRESDTWIGGAFALEQGFLFTAMLLSAATVAVIERRFRAASGWCLLGAGLSSVGLMHSFRWMPSDTALSLRPAWPWATGYASMALLFFVAPWITEEGGEN
jgi:AGZA family xanthine/uracil permease-like MFS transporter